MDDITFERKYKAWYEGDLEARSAAMIFHKNRKKFTHQSIYQYTLDSLKEEIEEKGLKESRRQKRKKEKEEGITLIKDDKHYKILRLDRFCAIKQYLANTALCITNIVDYYSCILDEGLTFYLIMVKGNYLKYNRYVYCIDKVNKESCWDEEDSEWDMVWSEDLMDMIRSDYNSCEKMEIENIHKYSEGSLFVQILKEGLEEEIISGDDIFNEYIKDIDTINKLVKLFGLPAILFYFNVIIPNYKEYKITAKYIVENIYNKYDDWYNEKFLEHIKFEDLGELKELDDFWAETLRGRGKKIYDECIRLGIIKDEV